MKVIMETDRLIIREMSMDDLDFMASIMSNPKAMKHYPKLYSRKEAAQIIEKQQFRYKLNGHACWMLIDKQLQKPVGELGLVMQSVERKAEPEIGYILHPDYWHKGYATEAAIATRDYAFKNFDYSYVISLIRPENLPSQAVARRVGMKVQRTAMFCEIKHLVFRIDKAELEKQV